MPRYYVSFSYQSPTGLGIAAVDATTTDRITCVDDLTSIKTDLARQGYHGVVIIAFSLYAHDTPAPTTPTPNPSAGRPRRQS